MVYQIILRTADLRKLNEAERRLLLTLGHAANEMAAFYRAAYAAGMDVRPDADLITQQVALAQTLLMLRMAASKMHELIKISEKDQEYSDIIGKSYPDFHIDRRAVKTLIANHPPFSTHRPTRPMISSYIANRRTASSPSASSFSRRHLRPL